jgi:hypothetical protein
MTQGSLNLYTAAFYDCGRDDIGPTSSAQAAPQNDRFLQVFAGQKNKDIS